MLCLSNVNMFLLLYHQHEEYTSLWLGIWRSNKGYFQAMLYSHSSIEIMKYHKNSSLINHNHANMGEDHTFFTMVCNQDGQQAIRKAHLSFQLRWANKTKTEPHYIYCSISMMCVHHSYHNSKHWSTLELKLPKWYERDCTIMYEKTFVDWCNNN